MSGISPAATSSWSVRGKRHNRDHRGHHQLLSGCREDLLRKVNGAWKVARRTIVLDANILLDKNSASSSSVGPVRCRRKPGGFFLQGPLVRTTSVCRRGTIGFGVISVWTRSKPTGRSGMELEEGFRHALNGEAMLFTGAGFSLGARNRGGMDFPLSTGLSQALMCALGENEAVPLQTAAELYTAKNGEVGLLAFLNDHLGIGEVAAHHKLFARVPWKRAYTTNYDEVFEAAARAEGRTVHVKVANEDTKLPLNGVSLVHLTGYLPYANPQNLNQSLILAETSYLTSRLIASPWSILLQSDVEAARAVIFVGYSMADLDIARILVAVENIRRKCVFVVGPAPSLALRTTLSKFGTLSSADLQEAARLLDTISKTHVPNLYSRISQVFANLDRTPVTFPTPLLKTFLTFM